MPVFFNENSLDEHQRARYSACVQEYRRIQFNNAEQEKNLLRSAGELTTSIAAAIDNQANQHFPTNKSALFWRLLQGKSALPDIPPTSFSYPWYQIIEEEGAFDVNVSWKRSHEHMFGMRFLSKNHNMILINGALWQIETMNFAASKLLKLHNECSQEDMKNVFDMQPEMIVKFRDWDSYRLFIGRKVICGRRDKVLEDNYTLENCGGNPKILEVINRGDDTIQENHSVRVNFIKPTYDSTDYDDILANTLFNTANSSEDNELNDLLKVEVDAWKLEKVKSP